MELWRRNVYLLWLVVFAAGICWTMIWPFMPLFLTDLGVLEGQEFWTGVLAAVASACTMIMSPVWGAVGDRFGRRLSMLRAGLFLTLSYSLMAVVRTPMELLGVRMMVGIMTGFVPMAIALVAVSTPRQHVGRALGTVQTAWPAGALIGPMLGGIFVDWVGLRSAMWMSSALLFLSTAAVFAFVKEEFTPPERAKSTILQDLKAAATNPALVSIIVVTTVSMASITALEPVLVPYLKGTLGPASPSWLAGLIYSLPGLAFIVAAPWWARRGEKIGYHRTVAIGLLVSGLIYIPQALVSSPWVFAMLSLARGLVGAAVGPGVAALLATSVPQDLRGRGFGLNQAAGSAGSVIGPLLGGAIGTYVGHRWVFLLTAAMMLGGYLWVQRVLSRRLATIERGLPAAPR